MSSFHVPYDSTRLSAYDLNRCFGPSSGWINTNRSLVSDDGGLGTNGSFDYCASTQQGGGGGGPPSCSWAQVEIETQPQAKMAYFSCSGQFVTCTEPGPTSMCHHQSCGDQPCQNGGYCFTDLHTEYPYKSHCVCPPHYGGSDCSNCLCRHGGKCTAKGCVCPPGYVGDYCQTKVPGITKSIL